MWRARGLKVGRLPNLGCLWGNLALRFATLSGYTGPCNK